jgi:hypothetical protein
MTHVWSRSTATVEGSVKAWFHGRFFSAKYFACFFWIVSNQVEIIYSSGRNSQETGEIIRISPRKSARGIRPLGTYPIRANPVEGNRSTPRKPTIFRTAFTDSFLKSVMSPQKESNPWSCLWKALALRLRQIRPKGPVIIYGVGGTNEKCFSWQNFADPTIKKSKIWLPNLKYQLKNKYPPLAKNFTKGNHSVVTHACPLPLLWHEFDNGLWKFCSLKFHVVCTCTFFGNNICLPTNRKMVKIVTLIDSHIVLTYDCWHCFLVSNISVSHALEMTISFYYPTLELFCFSFTHLLLTQNFVNQTLFSSVPPPAINNDRSLI